jgi:hypothetical protein
MPEGKKEEREKPVMWKEEREKPNFFDVPHG